jgi:cytochrome P450
LIVWDILRFFPTKDNREIASLKWEMRNLLTEIIGARKKAFDDGIEGGYGDDLLGHMLMTASTPDGAATGAAIFDFESVVDNTQMFYIAGQDTVAVVAGFSMLMLARHPEWQDRAHKEVHEVWATGTAIDASGLNRLKIVSSMQPHCFWNRTRPPIATPLIVY